MYSLKEELVIAEDIVKWMLDAYGEGFRYLKRASLNSSEPLSGRNGKSLVVLGEFFIPRCYYASDGNDTAHFNATELILCFNQLTYALLAEGIRRDILPELQMNSVKELKDAQVSRCYIGKFYDIIFRKPINPRNFSGRVSIEGSKKLRGNVFYHMKSEFSDDLGGSAQGRSLITIVTGPIAHTEQPNPEEASLVSRL